MSEQRYIVTGDDAIKFERIVSYPEDVQLYECDIEWLKAHEYEERTCEVVSVRHDPVYGAVYTLSCCDDEVIHDGEGDPPKHCQHCGAKVVDE